MSGSHKICLSSACRVQEGTDVGCAWTVGISTSWEVKEELGGWEETQVGRPSAGPEMGAKENRWVSEISRLDVLVLVIVK